MPVDLDLAAGCYLRDPDGHLRMVQGIDCMARDAITAGVRLFWAERLADPGVCYMRDRVILLAPWVAGKSPAFIRDVVGHELAHVAVGRDEETARCWQCRRYDELECEWMA